MRSTRMRRAIPLLVGGAVVVSMMTLPSSADTTAVRMVPGPGAVVRAVDPNQTATVPNTDTEDPNDTKVVALCPDHRWGTSSAKAENPCDVRIVFNQPVGAETKLTVKEAAGNAVSGKTEFRDSVAPPSISVGSVLTNIPDPDTIIFTPGHLEPDLSTENPDDTKFVGDALASGTYTAVAVAKAFDGHDGRCTAIEDDPTTPEVDESRPTANCHVWDFIVAPTAQIPVITSPTAGSTVNTRLFDVEGTAEPRSSIKVFRPVPDPDPTDEVVPEDVLLAEGGTDAAGDFKVTAPLLAGANSIYVEATSKPTTTRETVPKDHDNDPDTDPTVIDPPTVVSATASFSAEVDDDPDTTGQQDTTSPDLHLHGGGVQSIDGHTLDFPQAPVISGEASDNDQVDITVTVTTALGSPVNPEFYEVTCSGCGTPLAHFEVHFLEPGSYNLVVEADDPGPADPSTETAEMTVTYGDNLSEEEE